MWYIQDGHEFFEQGWSMSLPLLLGGFRGYLVNKMSKVACATFQALGDWQLPFATVPGALSCHVSNLAILRDSPSRRGHVKMLQSVRAPAKPTLPAVPSKWMNLFWTSSPQISPTTSWIPPSGLSQYFKEPKKPSWALPGSNCNGCCFKLLNFRVVCYTIDNCKGAL